MELNPDQIKKLQKHGLGQSVLFALEGLCPVCGDAINIDDIAEADELLLYNAFGICLDCIILHQEEDPPELVALCQEKALAHFKETFGC
jgi:hypothetical protein